MYGIDLSVQFENLMPALGLGFILAFVYDFVCFLKILISEGKVFVFITDMIYVIFCALSSFVLFLAVNSGHIRGYMVLAEILAAVVYRFTAGALIMPVFKKVADVTKLFFGKIVSPFCVLEEKISIVSRKIIKKAGKKLKKSKINFQNPLQDSIDM